MISYILNGKTPVPVEDILEWAEWMDNNNRGVKKTTLSNGVTISTVFLGYCTAMFGDEVPYFFETMIFYPKDWAYDNDEHETRYSTWDDAEQHHDILVKVLSQYV